MAEEVVEWVTVGKLQHCLPQGKHDLLGRTFDTSSLGKDELTWLLEQKSQYVRKAPLKANTIAEEPK